MMVTTGNIIDRLVGIEGRRQHALGRSEIYGFAAKEMEDVMDGPGDPAERLVKLRAVIEKLRQLKDRTFVLADDLNEKLQTYDQTT